MRIYILKMIAVTSILVVSGCIDFNDNTDNTIHNENYRLSYILNVTAENIINYTIILPIPIGWDYLIENLSIIKGNCTKEKINIETYPGIKIIGNSDISLRYEEHTIEKKDVFFIIPEPFNHTTKVYCEKNPLNGNIYIESKFSNIKVDGGKGHGWSIYGELSDGWHYVNMEGGGS